MVNVGAQAITPSASSQTITEGYHNGSGSVAGDADLVAGNIASGTNVFGVTGTALVATGDAAAANVLTGKSFSNASAVGVSGSMVNVGAQAITPSASSQTITEGYHNGSGSVAGDADLVAGNIVSGKDIFGVSGTGSIASGNATAANVLTGKSFSNVGAVGVSGSMVNVGAQAITPSTSSQSITEGYHNGSGSVAGDADLVAANIKKGTIIFGVTGTDEGPFANVSVTGQTAAYSTAGRDDGALEVGIPHVSPRFTGNSDGTVTDNSTGLIWLANANTGTRSWESALTYCNALADGTAGLTDGSSAGDWRMPNINELNSLVNYKYVDPAMSNDAGNSQLTVGAGSSFINVRSDYYWTSTGFPGKLLVVSVRMEYGRANVTAKSFGSHYVWPVRGGQ